MGRSTRAGVFAAGCALGSTTGVQAQDLGSHWVNEHSSVSGSADLNHCDEQAEAFDSIVTAWASWSGVTSTYGDSSVDPMDWAEPGIESWGADTATYVGIETFDVVYLSSHGGRTCNSPSTWSSYWRLGDLQWDASESDYISAVWTGDWTTTFRDVEIDTSEILILDTCHGVQQCVWSNQGYRGLKDDGASAGLSLMAGYHGLSYDTVGQVNALEDYVNASRLEGVGDNWLDYRYDPSINGFEQCPALIVYGSSQANTDNFYEHGGLDDYPSTGTNDVRYVYYIAGCDPDGGEQL